MTTTTDARVNSAEGGARPEPKRRGQWWAGWRVALRLARRDVRRNRGRSALIVLMIGLPVMLLAFGATLAMTANLTSQEEGPYLYGTGEAVVSGPVGSAAIEQGADGRGWGTSDDSPDAPKISGIDTDPTAAISALVGGSAIPFESPDLRATIDDARTTIPALAINLPPGADLGERAHLLSGRWAAGSDEVVVTRYGADLGLPTSGRLDLEEPGYGGIAAAGASPNAQSATGRAVVGIAEAFAGGSSGGPISPAAVVVPFDGTPSSWLVTDAKPIDWAAVQRLNRYALVVTSKAVTSLPPDELALLDPETFAGDQSQALAAAIAAASGGLLLTTTLLAGPAFAVSASRQRRTLALAAANGGTVAQVRRFVLGQAVVLGAAAAVIGAALGLGAFFVLRGLHLKQLLELSYSPVDVPWALIGLVVAVALVSAVVAALIPARSLGRLDIVRVLRGQEVSRPLRHRLMIVGLVLCGIGTVTALTQTVSDSGISVTAFLIGSVVLTLGALCLVPALLVLSARLAGRLPLTMRMAARDSARQRARTAPTVAAVLATTALFSAACIGLASDTAKRADTYVPQLSPGMGTITVGYTGSYASPSQSAVSDLITRTAPKLRVLNDSLLGNPNRVSAASASGAVPDQQIAAIRNGCTAKEALENPFVSGLGSQCASLSTSAFQSGQVRVLPASQLREVLGLTPRQIDAVKRGAIVLPDPRTVQSTPRKNSLASISMATVDVDNGQVAFVVQAGERDLERDTFTATGPSTRTELPALFIPFDRYVRLQNSNGVGGIMASEGTTRLGWTSTPDEVGFYAAAGPVTRDTQQRLEAAFEAQYEYSNVYVERGFERNDLPVVLALVGVVALLILVATFVSTALSLAEQQPLMGTLAAVGATRATRRRMAASQALNLAGLGALIGSAVGLIPGIAIARATTFGRDFDGVAETTFGPFVEIPWLQIVAPVVLVPLIAAAFAWLAVRRSPQVTRRLG